MYQIDNDTASAAKPASTSMGTPGYFTDGNPATGLAATVLPAEFMNTVMLEMIGVLDVAGIAPDKAKPNQLAAAIRSLAQAGASSYSRDTGAVNAYVVGFVPVVTTPVDGMVLHFLAKTTSTGAATLKVDGLAAVPLLNTRHAPLLAGQIAVGSLCAVQYVTTLKAWVLLQATGAGVPSTIAGYGITDAYTKAEIDAKLGAQTKVVNTPNVTGSASVTAGTSVTLTASATSLLSGGTIASFTWTLPDGTSTTTAASSNASSKVVVATGSIGTNYVVKVYATDGAGNTSAVATKNIAITNHVAPTAPTAVTVGSTVYQNSTGNTLTVSGSTASDGATLTYSLSQSGAVALTFSKTSGIAANEVVTFNAPAVAADTPVTLTVLAIDSLGGQSTTTSITVTVYAIPTTAGAPFGGGYYTAKLNISGVNYALVIAPKASGETTALMTYSEAQIFCTGLNIGGFNDWIIPTNNMTEAMYRAFKPTADSNSETADSPYNDPNGVNPDTVPAGTQYTLSNPAQTMLAAWQSGGSEAISTSNYLWSSSTANTNNKLCRRFDSGYYTEYYTSSKNAILRAVRLVKI